jgi:hypothetical protein
VCQRYNQFIEVCWALNQGFPFSPLQAGQDSDGGWWLRGNVYVAFRGYVVFLFWYEHLVSRSRAQQVCTLDLEALTVMHELCLDVSD